MALDIVRQRLHNQFLSHPDFTEPSQVVETLGAVQSQDYSGGKWALGLRMNGATDAAIDQAFNEGKILRTHILRPTWHFVAPQDIRWMLKLTAPRVHAVNGFRYRQLGLDRETIQKSYKVLENVLQGNKHLTRTELGSALEKTGIKNAKEGRLGYLIISAELDGIICSGARRGKQFTYALLEERAPNVKSLEKDEALAELTRRYFVTRGPATLHDFTWWSGLTMVDAKEGIEAVKSKLACETIDSHTYWFANAATAKKPSVSVHLLPNYDEYMVGYTNRTLIFNAAHTGQLDSRRNILFQYAITINGLAAGTWRRTIKKNEVAIKLSPFTALTDDQNQALIAATGQYGKFLELPVVLEQCV